MKKLVLVHSPLNIAKEKRHQTFNDCLAFNNFHHRMNVFPKREKGKRNEKKNDIKNV